MIGELLHIQGTKPLLLPDTLGHIFGMPISNVWMMTWLIGLVFIVLMIVLHKKIALIPSKFQLCIELVVEFMDNLIFQISGSKSTARILLPIVGPLFLFLLFSNTIGIIPFIGSVTYDGVPLFRTATNDYNMTLTLGILVSFFINGASMLQMGFFPFIGKFIQIKGVINGFKKGFMGGFEGLINMFVGIMDIIGEIAKVLSMTLRLFGNIYAGEVMTVVFYSLFSVVAPGPWHILSTFSGVIQALVFSLLTIVFYTLAVTPEESKI